MSNSNDEVVKFEKSRTGKYCDKCGNEILKGEQYMYDEKNDIYFCSECALKLDETHIDES